MMKWNNRLIKKAINHYKYFKQVEDCTPAFMADYDFFARKENLKKYPFVIWSTLGGVPECTHIAAKNLLFQENPDCWKFFERTALFWTMSQINDPWIDQMKAVFEYNLYVERADLIKILFKKTEEYLNSEEYKTDEEYKKQKVYPSAQLVQFLIEKWMGHNPVKNRILEYGTGYGIYQKLVDHWDNLSNIEPLYWDELCEYHLKGLSLEKPEQYKYEEFLASGLVPMELLNVIKVRKKLGLDIPVISHELFQTPMAKDPQIPTGYDERLDIKYQLVKQTVETKNKLTYNDIEAQLKNDPERSGDLFL